MYSLQNINIVYKTQDTYHYVMWCILCPLGPFLLAQSHMLKCIVCMVFNVTHLYMK